MVSANADAPAPATIAADAAPAAHQPALATTPTPKSPALLTYAVYKPLQSFAIIHGVTGAPKSLIELFQAANSLK